ncbi:MAG: hypothetical protein MJA32_01100 [Proteobacteria bacterium]|nr:hypothetical protein [Pseudomonadota bacterium]
MKPEQTNAAAAIHYLDGANRGVGDTAPGLRLAEESEIYVPDLLADDGFEPASALYAAADDHAAGLREAERCIDEALHLADVLRAAMGGAGDRRAMQVDTVLGIVGQKLSQAHGLLDEHDTRHTNLFMAYAKTRERSAGR